jgi:hypothetical protein
MLVAHNERFEERCAVWSDASLFLLVLSWRCVPEISLNSGDFRDATLEKTALLKEFMTTALPNLIEVSGSDPLTRRIH